MRKEQDYNRDLKIELEGRKKKYKFRSQFGFTNINYIKIVVEKERMRNTIYIPLFTCIQQNINYSIFNLLFIRITIESILDELKNRDDLHCFFYMDKDVLENIKKEHVEITTSYSISDIVSCLRFYAKEFKDYSAYKKVEDYTKEKKHSIFRINIERLNMPSVFLSVL